MILTCLPLRLKNKTRTLENKLAAVEEEITNIQLKIQNFDKEMEHLNRSTKLLREKIAHYEDTEEVIKNMKNKIKALR